MPIFGRDRVIGDRRLPDSTLTVGNDRDYATVRAAAAGLLPLRERDWRQLFFSLMTLKASPAGRCYSL